MTEEMLINSLALVGAGTIAYAVIRVLGAIAAWAQRIPELDAAAPPVAAVAAVAPAPEADDVARDDIAVIAAAVYAVLDGHRIVHIEDSATGFAWSADGRRIHQTSHRPH